MCETQGARFFGTLTKTDFQAIANGENRLGSGAGWGYNRDMEEVLIELAVFLAGAASGALLKYLQDRKLLRVYGELVRQLTGSLRQQVAPTARLDQEGRTLAETNAKARAGSNVLRWPP